MASPKKITDFLRRAAAPTTLVGAPVAATTNVVMSQQPKPTPAPAPSPTPTGGLPTQGMTGTSNTPMLQPQGDPAQSLLQNYLDVQNNPQFTYLTGGPNQALINQLAQQSKQKLEQYKQNRADAENMYGQLTAKVEGFGTQMGSAYDASIAGTQQQGQASQQALAQELANQAARRSSAFKELGIEREGALTNFGSDTALNEAMGNILSSSNAWASLLGSQKGGAMERNKSLQTALGSTLNQTVLGMKQQYDAMKEYYDSQISAEKSKTATRKLNELGKMFSKGTLDKLKEYTFGSGGASGGNTDIERKLASWNAVPSAKYGAPATFPGGPQAWVNMMIGEAQRQYSKNDAAKKGVGVDPDIIRFAQNFGLGSYLGVDTSAFWNG
jgi:hypothetical protein